MEEVFITEIFKSFQGESTYSGRLTSFIRLSECNLSCSICDTKYSWSKGHKLHKDQLLQILKNLNTPYWCITGGEPLLQAYAVKFILDTASNLDIKTSVETNGSLEIIPELNTKWVVDVKTPSTGEVNSFNFKNLDLIQPKDEIKFVISDDIDWDFTRNFIDKYKLLSITSNILISPNLDTNMKYRLPKLIIEWGKNLIFQPQLHKLIQEKPIYILERSNYDTYTN